MLKNVLIAAAILIASPAVVFSQDIFWSFDSSSLQSNSTQVQGASGTAYIFADGLFGFDFADINFTTSDSAVVLLTGGQSFNDEFITVGGTAFNSSDVTIDPSGSNGNLSAAAGAGSNFFNPEVWALFNPHFEAGVGANGATLLASVDYSVVGSGTATLDLSSGPGSVSFNFGPLLNPSYGPATLNAIPEPSAAIMLVLGSLGVFARRCKRRGITMR